MTRVAALVVLAIIIVGSGFWLARDRSTSTGPAADAPSAAATPEAPAADTPPSAEVPPDSPQADEERQTGAPDGAATAGAEPDAEASEADGSPGPVAEVGSLAPVALSDGYTEVDYLSDVPVQAFDAPRQVLDAGLEYEAVLRTNRGDITVDLFDEAAPQTVNNFVFLALNRYYDGVPFHRVLEGFMAQTGDPTGTGRGGPGYAFDDEISQDLSFDTRGVLAMANAGKDAQGNGTNGSQFFLTFEPTPWLDGNHTIFGRVVAGDPVLDEITRIDPSTPSAIAFFGDTLAQLREQGVDIPGADDEKVSDAIEALLGALPLTGQTFAVAGRTAVVGTAGGDPAFGFWPSPDELLTVVIAARPR